LLPVNINISLSALSLSLSLSPPGDRCSFLKLRSNPLESLGERRERKNERAAVAAVAAAVAAIQKILLRPFSVRRMAAHAGKVPDATANTMKLTTRTKFSAAKLNLLRHRRRRRRRRFAASASAIASFLSFPVSSPPTRSCGLRRR